MILEDMSLKARLARFGIDVVNVSWPDGRYRGVKLEKDGACIHDTPVAGYDYGLSIVEPLEAGNTDKL